jgi:AcrR family transcriptional regulator
VTGRRDRKKQQTRAALIEAALRLADERGLERVTVEDISEAADVSARTFFNYFASKDDAITGDYLFEVGPLDERFRAVPAGVPVITALREAMLPMIEQMEADRELWLLRMRVLAAHPYLLPKLLSSTAHADRAMVDAVIARTGVPPDHGFPPLVVAVTGAAVRTAMVRWAGGDGRHGLQLLLDEALLHLTSGLADPVPATELIRRTPAPTLARRRQ